MLIFEMRERPEGDTGFLELVVVFLVSGYTGMFIFVKSSDIAIMVCTSVYLCIFPFKSLL